MTAKDFRQIALALPETEERRHMDHPDFRVAGKIFATLGYPDKTRGMVKLSPEDQHYFSKDYPNAFMPIKGRLGTPRRHQRPPQSREERRPAQSPPSRLAQHGPEKIAKRKRTTLKPSSTNSDRVSRGAAKECSPRRQPWVAKR